MSEYFGLDLGASSIKLCKAQPMGKQFRVEAISLAQNPVGSLDFSNQENKQKIGEAIKQLLKEAGIRDRRVVVAISESHVYSRVVEMPTMSDAELSSAIQWEAEQFVPVPIEEVEMDYTVVRRPPKGAKNEKMLVYLIASQKKYLQSFVDFLVELGLEPVAIESEMVALTRAFAPLLGEGVSLVLHLGALSSAISIMSGEALVFSHALPTGGVAITRALAQALSLPLPQAEQYKRTYGLDEQQLEGKVRQAILVVFQNIVLEVRRAMEFYASSSGSQVSRIVLSGGGAYMPEITTYLSGEFQGMEVLVGDAFLSAKETRDTVIPEERAVYSVAVGLALRDF